MLSDRTARAGPCIYHESRPCPVRGRLAQKGEAGDPNVRHEAHETARCECASRAHTGATSSAASAKAVLVLKEEGRPVAVNTELEVELELYPECTLAWRAHMSLNDARTDKIAVEPVEQECESNELYPSYFWGRADEVELAHTGKAKIAGWWRELYENDRNPGPYCTIQFEQLRGKLELPGPVQTPAAGRFTLIEEERPYGGSKCEKKGTIHRTVTVRGHNGKPLEADVVG